MHFSPPHSQIHVDKGALRPAGCRASSRARTHARRQREACLRSDFHHANVTINAVINISPDQLTQRRENQEEQYTLPAAECSARGMLAIKGRLGRNCITVRA